MTTPREWLRRVFGRGEADLTDAEEQQQFLRDGQYCPAIKPLPEMDRILANDVVYEQKKCDKPVEPQRAVEAVVHASMPVKAFLLARF